MTSTRRFWPGSLLLALVLMPQSGFTEGLTVALTNDDGWDAPGIQMLKNVLRDRGHTVTMVGSSTPQSGSSAALNRGRIVVTKRADREYSAAVSEVDGAEPVSCGLLAIDIATTLDGRKPDVLMSGINSGANIGTSAQHSGTVGAVIAALNPGFNGPVPGIAVSTDEPDCDDDCVDAHYRRVAEFAADLVAHLQTKPGFLAEEDGLLPMGIGLNVNYPAVTNDRLEGVRVTQQSMVLGLSGGPTVFNIRCEDCRALAIGESATSSSTRTEGSPPDADSDVAAFYDGYVTIVPIEASFTAAHYTDYTDVITIPATPRSR